MPYKRLSPEELRRRHQNRQARRLRRFGYTVSMGREEARVFAVLQESGGRARYGSVVSLVRGPRRPGASVTDRERRGRAILDLIGRMGAEGKVRRAGPNGCYLELCADAQVAHSENPIL